ncbi:putative fatty acyl-CoA reductase CG5065 [Atheta coriaria]|uniref:putative fatty acyl-CoA reductase CG5065 n=1 Tax=Dalotia coriaria TaxID=877792 RepID=UPI0031F33D17
MGVTAQPPQQITDHHLKHPPNETNNNKNVVLRHNSINNSLNTKSLYISNAEELKITDFYRGLNIFITGGTGFVGKSVIEKLLRTCDGIGNIYMLIRAKRGMNALTRLQELFKNPLFEKIKEKDETLLEKIIPIEGDVSLPMLGISEEAKRLLVENVHVVFHSAATVRFSDSLKTAIVLNTQGTKRILELAMEMKKLKSYVHVSTAYSNSDKDNVDEVVYEPPANPYHMIRCAETLSDEAMSQLEKLVVTKHPNTYTFTKAMAESIVQEYAGKLPTAIVRPSIVTNAWKEPFEGWIDHSTGVTGIMMEMGRGGVQIVYGDYDNQMDIVPVDFVTNTLITAAWHTVAKRSNTMRIYNCTSGHDNNITWGEFSQMTVASARKFPSKYITWYPQVIFTKNRFFYYLIQMFMQRAPALLADLLLICTRRKPIMYRFAKKVERNVKIGEFFVSSKFKFDVNNLAELQGDVRAAADGDNFPMDVSKRHLDWRKYNELCMLGIRRSVLKDDISSLPHARRRLNGYYWLKKILQLLSVYVLLKMTIW